MSYWENGKVDLRNVHPRRLAAYASVLRITLQELADLSGYKPEELFPDGYPASADPTHAERRGWVLPEEEEPEIPEALLIAAQKYGHGEHAGLSERGWLLELADLDFREEPETPEDWLAIYSRLSRVIRPKKRGN